MQINCELGCLRLIAEDDDPDEARELAFESGAIYEREAGEWVCAECVQAHYEEGMREAAAYDEEMRLRQTMEDDRNWRDEILARGDTIRDRERGNK